MAIGFNTEQREDDNPYTGKLVRIDTTVRSYFGYYQESKGGQIILCPSYVHEPVFDSKGKSLTQFRFEEQIPTTIWMPGANIQSVSEEAMKRILESDRLAIEKSKSETNSKNLGNILFL